MDLKEELSKRVVTVTFTKKNGDERVMECTRNMEKVPPSKFPKSALDTTADSTIRVFDIKAQDWRSFVVANVKDFK